MNNVKDALSDVLKTFHPVRAMQEIYDHHKRVEGQVTPEIEQRLSDTKDAFAIAVETFIIEYQRYMQKK